MGLKDRAVSGVKWNSVATIYAMVVQILRLAILTRLLAKSDFGLVAIATMVINFTDIFSDLGITVAIISKTNITREQYSSVFWLNAITSAVIFTIVCLVSPLIASFYNEQILVYIIPLLGVQILLNSFGKMFQTIKTKNLEFSFISRIRILSVTIGFVFTIVLAYLGMGVYSLVTGHLIQVFVNQIIFIVCGIHEERILFHFNIREIKDMLVVGGYKLGSSFLDFVSEKIDVFLIGKFFGMDDLGVYNLAKELVLKPFQVIKSVINNVASATFAKMQGDDERLRVNYSKLVRAVGFIAIPIYIATFVFSDFIVSILYANEFFGVAVFLRILSIVGMITSIDGVASTLQIALGRTDIGMKWTVVRVCISVTSIYIASFFSIYAVAIGQALVAIICYFLYWRFAIYSLIKLKLKDYLLCVFESLGVGVVLSIPFLLINTLFKFDVYWQLLELLLFGISYLLYYYFVRMDILKTYTVDFIRRRQ